jgi:hypothetical protein
LWRFGPGQTPVVDIRTGWCRVTSQSGVLGVEDFCPTRR